MALIEAAEFAGTKKWSEPAAWIGVKVPGAGDDVVLGEKSGIIEANGASVKCRSFDALNYKATFLANAVIMEVGAATSNEGMIFRLGAGMTFNATSGNTIVFVSTSGTNESITTAGKLFSNLIFNGAGGKYKLTDKLESNTTARTIKLEKGELKTANQEVVFGKILLPGANAKALDLGSSTIKLTGNSFAGTAVWEVSASGTTFTAGTSTIELTAAGEEANKFIGGAQSYCNLTIATGNVEVSGSNTFTGTLRFTTAGKTKATKFAKGTTQQVAVIAGNGKAGSLVKLESTEAGKAWTINATGLLSIDFIELKDGTATGEPAYAGTHSTSVSGNVGWKFEAVKHEHTLSVSQGQSTSIARSAARYLAVEQSQSASRLARPSRVLSTTQPQSASVELRGGKTLSLVQPQTATLAHSLTRKLTVSQPQSVTLSHPSTRALSVSQGQAVTHSEALTRKLSISQGQASTLTHSHGYKATLVVSQAQVVTLAAVIEISESPEEREEHEPHVIFHGTLDYGVVLS